MNLTVKHGFSDDCKLIRTEVFIDEQGFVLEFDEIDAKAEHIVLYDGGTPVATGRTFYEADPTEWHIGRIAVRKPYRGQKIGAAVVRELEQIAAKNGAESAFLSAQVRAKGFYESIGYIPEGEIYMDEDCPHIAMRKAL